jgi:hypothetical protein
VTSLYGRIKKGWINHLKTGTLLSLFAAIIIGQESHTAVFTIDFPGP